MCRICGFRDFNYKGGYELEKTAVSMRDSLIHGGPDDAGTYIESNRALGLAHRRLSIIDLSQMGHQPMYDESGNFCIVYNGEVYNFKEIKDELAALGYVFKSHSDTEVVLYSYMQWGRECVKKFRGMWAFVIWDKHKEQLILCRDRVGVKPLYWYYKNGLFMFSSELKAFHHHPGFSKKLNEEAVALYLQYGYITAPHSIFQHTYKLLPGHFLTIDKNQEIKQYQYWNCEDYFQEGLKNKDAWLKRSEDEILEEIEHILIESFKLRLVSDVPVGIFLSGGIDSTVVTALLKRQSSAVMKTFTIGFHEKAYNEAGWAKKVAAHLGTEHTEFYCTTKEAFEVVPKLSEIYDEPFGDSSAIPTFLVSRLAGQKVKVVLSADGGDEQFCGYMTYWRSKDIIRLINTCFFKRVGFPVLNYLGPDAVFTIYRKMRFLLPNIVNVRDSVEKLIAVTKENSLPAQYDTANKYFLEENITALGVKFGVDHFSKMGKREEMNLLTWAMLFDQKNYLPDDILVKIDRATMSVALEGREPLLDHKILEFSSQLPLKFKYKNRISKYILKKILYKYIPENLVNRPKQGFGIPIQDWFKNDLKNFYLDYLGTDRIKKEGFFNPKEVQRLLKGYLQECSGINASKLWFLFMFQRWKERWL